MNSRPARRIFRNPGAAWLWIAISLVAAVASEGADARTDRYLIYLHGRIVQEQQIPRPRSERFGYYELEKILDVFRSRGFVVTGEIRPKSASESESADRVVAEVRRLLESGVRPDHITVLGASMGASITLLASTRLQNADVRFAALGPCLSESVPALRSQEGRAPSGHLLAIREASDDLLGPCKPWKAESDPRASLVAKEIVLHTGLSHGFLYRPLPEWVEPVIDWANAR